MERPSHMIFRHQTISHRLTWAGLSLFLPAGMFWLFANGLTASTIRQVLPPNLIIEAFKQEQPKKPPPPAPKIVERIEIPKVQMPVIDIPRESAGTAITATTQQAIAVTPPPAVPDRAPVAVTRSTPAYPVIARRVGWEGAVMLRLTVSAQGRVTQAAIVTSSGHVELDSAAQEWVVAHWTYRPAIKGGSAIEAQVLTRILFTLDGQR